MKPSLLFFSIIALIFSACTEPMADNSELDRLKALNTELQEELDYRNKSVEGLLSGMEAVQNDMRDIASREGLLKDLTVSDSELASSPQQQIVEDIALVDELIKRNRERITQLENSVKSSNGKLNDFEKLVQNLKQQILDKERDLSIFKDNLIAMEANYAALLDDYQTQTIISGMQDEALHKVFFAYGSKDELVENKVIEKAGGVLGVGKTWVLDDEFNQDYFTEADRRTMDRLPLSADRIDLISNHPEDSYELLKDGKLIKELRITDAAAFWSRSSYLVVVVD